MRHKRQFLEKRQIKPTSDSMADAYLNSLQTLIHDVPHAIKARTICNSVALPRSRSIDDGFNTHIHTSQPALMALISLLRLRLIPVSAQGVVAIGAARVLARAVCIKFSLEVVDADAAVIGVVGIVRTTPHGVGVGIGIEHTFTTSARSRGLLEVFEALGHALWRILC